MKTAQVKVGATYAAKVSGQVVPVRIVEEKWTGDKHTGWIGVNTRTRRPVRIKSAQKLRRELAGDHSEQGDPPPTKPPAKPPPAKPAGTKATKAADAKQPKPDASPAAEPPAASAPAPTSAKPKAPKPPKPERPKRTSGLDAAAMVLKDAAKPMSCKEIVAEAAVRGLWQSPGGKTPEATVYAAIIREIAAKGEGSRFRKADRGAFEHTGIDG